MGKPPILLAIGRTILIYICLLMAAAFLVSAIFLFGQKEAAANADTLKPLESGKTADMLGWLQPEIPVDMEDPPFGRPPMPTVTVPVSEVLEKGREIPLEFIYDDPDWQRPSYKTYWHGSHWRWSYVPNRIHYAMHRMFTTYPTASVYYDFIHDLGIAEEAEKFRQYLPGPDKTTGKVNPYVKVETVVMQTDVIKAVTYGNQVVLIGKPRRTGLQALVIPVNLIQPFDDDEFVLFQLATDSGDEMDYSLIKLAKPVESE